VKKEMAALKAARKEERVAEARLFKGAFGPSPPPQIKEVLQGEASGSKPTGVRSKAASQERGVDQKQAQGTTVQSLMHLLYAWTLGWLISVIFAKHNGAKNRI
jgi:hypothetical protein